MAEVHKETAVHEALSALESPPIKSLFHGKISEICVSDSEGNYLIIRGEYFEVRAGKQVKTRSE